MGPGRLLWRECAVLGLEEVHVRPVLLSGLHKASSLTSINNRK